MSSTLVGLAAFAALAARWGSGWSMVWNPLDSTQSDGPETNFTAVATVAEAAMERSVVVFMVVMDVQRKATVQTEQ